MGRVIVNSILDFSLSDRVVIYIYNNNNKDMILIMKEIEHVWQLKSSPGPGGCGGRSEEGYGGPVN